jgi:hypothetical protein
MKKVLLFLTALLCVTSLYAQRNQHKNNKFNNKDTLRREIALFPEIEHYGAYEPVIPEDAPRTNEEVFQRAELVFEGNQLNCLATYDTKGNKNRYDMYGVVAYYVNKVYKGDQALTGDTIYVVERGWGLGAEKIVPGMYHVRYMPPYCLAKRGFGFPNAIIHFFTTSDFPENGIPAQYANVKKYKIMEQGFDDFYYGSRIYVQDSIICGLNELFFYQQEDFYNYMKQFDGYVIPEPPKEPELRWLNGDEWNALVSPEFYEKQKALMNSIQKEIAKEKQKNSKKKQKRMPKAGKKLILSK